MLLNFIAGFVGFFIIVLYVGAVFATLFAAAAGNPLWLIATLILVAAVAGFMNMMHPE